jgi:two-component system, sporulation sensor kinase C
MAEFRTINDVFKHAATGLAITDVTGNVVDVNKAFAKIVDRSPAEMQNANIFGWTHPEDQSRHVELLQQLLAAKIPSFVIEKRYLRGDGSVVWVRNSVSLMIDEPSSPGQVVSICEDISDRKRAEGILKRQEQMAAIGRLTSSILHEINNPLEAVGNLIFLARQAASAVEAAGYLKQAEEELAHASEITSQGLQFHRQSSAATSTNVVELLRSVLALFAGRLKETRVHADLTTDDAPELMCFPGEIRQVFVNLISNAIDSMAKGGQLKIRVRPSSDWRTGEHGVRVTIADTGEGMSLETRTHIYQAFFTTKGAQGSGLGLWVTSNIVKKHQGCMHVRSKCASASGGTVFSVVFPYRGAQGKVGGYQVPAA